MLTGNAFDPIAAVEALYRVERESSAWLTAVMTAFHPLLDREQHGLFAGFYRCQDPLSFAPEPFLSVEANDRLRTAFGDGLGALGDDFVAGAFLCPGIVRGTEIDGWAEIPPVRDGVLGSLGLVDNRSIVAIEPDGAGCRITTFHESPAVLRGAERLLVGNLCRHFLAAHRLHRRLCGRPISADDAAAVLNANGYVHHAQGAAKDPAQRAALKEAVAINEGARASRRHQDPLGALGAWESLVMGRWTLVDHFDHDGRRYLLAHENGASPPGLHLLTPREREIVERAVLGNHNKGIAYDLGLSHSTVKVLMSRAIAKLGLRTRSELVAKLSELTRWPAGSA